MVTGRFAPKTIRSREWK